MRFGDNVEFFFDLKFFVSVFVDFDERVDSQFAFRPGLSFFVFECLSEELVGVFCLHQVLEQFLFDLVVLHSLFVEGLSMVSLWVDQFSV